MPTAYLSLEKLQLNTTSLFSPGFELTSSEGIHVLCIYPTNTADEQTSRFLGEFGIRETGTSSNLANCRFTEVLDLVGQQGGIAVAAHITTKNGLLKVLGGRARMEAWKDENLLAVQIPGPVDDLEFSSKQIVLNKSSDYRRSHGIAAINARDITKVEDLDDPSASCWIKMSKVSVEGLRQAFLDPESRIRLNSDPTPEEHMELLSIKWEGGFLNDTAVNFNPNLNVLVGGRGAGKSTIIESLRYVLNLEPLGEDARTAHQGMVRQVLRNGTKISLRVRTRRPAVGEYLIERIIPNSPVVRDSAGNVSHLSPADILPRVEVYGQHEISELARSKEKLTGLLERFVTPNVELGQRKEEVRQRLARLRRDIVEIQSEMGEIDERLATLPSLEETLRQYREAGI